MKKYTLKTCQQYIGYIYIVGFLFMFITELLWPQNINTLSLLPIILGLIIVIIIAIYIFYKARSTFGLWLGYFLLTTSVYSLIRFSNDDIYKYTFPLLLFETPYVLFINGVSHYSLKMFDHLYISSMAIIVIMGGITCLSSYLLWGIVNYIFVAVVLIYAVFLFYHWSKNYNLFKEKKLKRNFPTIMKCATGVYVHMIFELLSGDDQVNSTSWF